MFLPDRTRSLLTLSGRPSAGLAQRKLKFPFDGNFQSLQEFLAKRIAHCGTQWITLTHNEPFSGRAKGKSVLLY
jgi:hypothetical protein